jgi:hypothetical protein
MLKCYADATDIGFSCRIESTVNAYAFPGIAGVLIARGPADLRIPPVYFVSVNRFDPDT